MEVREMQLDELKEYEHNPRYISQDAVEKVAESIKEFGFKVPIIVDEYNTIVTGHTRKRAAEFIGLKTVPTIVASDLSDEQIKAFRLADNKVSEFSEWNEELLQEELKSLEQEMDLFGFDIKDMEMPDFQPVDEDTQPALDEFDPIMVKCPHCQGEFDAREQT